MEMAPDYVTALSLTSACIQLNNLNLANSTMAHYDLLCSFSKGFIIYPHTKGKKAEMENCPFLNIYIFGPKYILFTGYFKPKQITVYFEMYIYL